MKRFILTTTIKKYDLMRKKAKEEGISISELMRRLIDAFLEETYPRERNH